MSAARPAANYPFQHWWVATSSAELEPGRLLARRLLGHDLVLYRRRDGIPIALVNFSIAWSPR